MRLGGQVVRAGNEAFLAENGVTDFRDSLEAADRAGATPVLIAEGSRFAGAILLRDTPKSGAHDVVREIEDLGIANVILLTGDRRKAADAMARVEGISHVEAELLPEQKLDRIKQLQVQGRKVAMIGDGVNDRSGPGGCGTLAWRSPVPGRTSPQRRRTSSISIRGSPSYRSCSACPDSR